MHAHFLQHVPFEGLGSIENWLQQNNCQISHTPLYESAALPDPAGIDLLIIMGGPMSIHDETQYPWLVQEKQFIRAVIDRGTPVLGVCLGAQLIASVLGANIYPNNRKEIGWFPIYRTAHDNSHIFLMPAETDVFHWHGETFDLPDGATRLAQSDACENQAFQWGEAVIGLQFHLETTPESARAIIDHCGDELVVDDFVQPAQRILSAPESHYLSINALMGKVLEHLTRPASAG